MLVNSHKGVDTWRYVRKILSKIKYSNNSTDDINLSNEELEDLMLDAFKELLENNELSSSIEADVSLDNLIFDEKELVNAMKDNDGGLKKYFKRLFIFKIVKMEILIKK